MLSLPEADLLVTLFLRNPSRQFSKEQAIFYSRLLMADRKFKNWGITLTELSEAFSNKYAFRIFTEIVRKYGIKVKPVAQIFLFKATEVIMCFEKIAQFTGAKNPEFRISYWVLIRDPRAIFASQKCTFVPHRGEYMNNNPLLTVYQWNRLLHDMEVFTEKAIPFQKIQYEELVLHNKSVLQNLTGTYYTEQNTKQESNYKDRIEQNEQAMHPNIGKAPIRNRIYSWETLLSTKEVYLIEAYCKRGMLTMGYNPVDSRAPFCYAVLWLRCKTDLLLYSLKSKLMKLSNLKY
jgi:hypothetical protein